MTKGLRVGYIRVSTEEQNTSRQLEGVSTDKVFIDKFTGKVTERPQFESMMGFLREGDHLIIHSTDRLSRKLKDLLNIVETLNKRGVTIEFVKNNMVITGKDSSMSILMLQMMAMFAEHELNIMKERQAEGIALAKKRGVYAGRKKKLNPEQIAELRLLFKDRNHKKRELAERFGISIPIVYKYGQSEV